MLKISDSDGREYGYLGVFRCVTPCDMAGNFQAWTMKMNVVLPPKRWSLSTERHGVNYSEQPKKHEIEMSSESFKGATPAAESECTWITNFSPVISDEF